MMIILNKYNVKYIIIIFWGFVCFQCSDPKLDRKISLHNSEPIEEIEELLNDDFESELDKLKDIYSNPDRISVLITKFDYIGTDSTTSIMVNNINHISRFLLSQIPEVLVKSVEELKIVSGNNNLSEDNLIKLLQKNQLIDFYIKASVSVQQNLYSFTYSLIDAESEGTISTNSSTVSDEDRLLEVVNDFVSTVFSSILPTEMSSYFQPSQTSMTAMKSFIEGYVSHENNNFISAFEKYLLTINQDPNFGTSYVWLTSLFFQYEDQIGNYDIERLIELSEQFDKQFNEEESLVLDAYTNYYYNKTKEAESIFNTLIDKYPDNINGPFGLAKLKFNEGLFEDALKITFNNETFFNMTPLLDVRLEVYKELSKYDEALDLLRQLDYPGVNKVYQRYEEAVLYNLIGWKEESLNSLDKALFIKPDFIQAKIQKSYILMKQMRFEDTINEILSIDYSGSSSNLSYMIESNFNMILSYIYLGQYTAAKSLAEQLAIILEDYGLDYYNELIYLSTINMLLNNELQINNFLDPNLESILEEAMYDQSLFILLSMSAIQTNYSDFIQKYESIFRIITQKPSNYQLTTIKIKDAFSAYSNDNFDISINLFTELIAEEYNPALQYFLSLSYFEKGDYSSAEKNIDQIYEQFQVENFATSLVLPKLYLLQADIYEKTNRIEQSKQIYENLKSKWKYSDRALNVNKKLSEKLNN